MDGFKKFLLRGNVVDLAVAVIIGAAFGAIVTAFTASFITPLIAAIAGKADFSKLYFTVHHSKFTYGVFINAVVSFLIIASVIYFFVVVPVNTLMQRYKPTPDEPTPTKECPECLSMIPMAARKCAFCTSVQ
jgi:large conductance mechanosensitive channel